MPDPCERTLCVDDAEVMPVVVMRKRGYEHLPIRAGVGLRLCRAHAAELTVAKLVTDSFWLQTMMGIAGAGRALPDRDLTTIEIIALDSAEARALFSVATRLPKPSVH